MENLRKFRLKADTDEDAAWEALENAGALLHACVEEVDGVKELFGIAEDGPWKEKFSFLESVEAVEYPEIDWTEQWENHALNYHEGVVEVELPGFPSVFLVPGPGFGDLSHPTTRLMLELMKGNVEDAPIIDVGSGSGVLSLASVAMGASVVVGIDIDEAAVVHATNNAQRNEMEERVEFFLPEAFAQESFPENAVVLINMIRSEQEVAWQMTKCSLINPTIAITSGVRVEEREEYLAQAAQWGWKLQEEREEEDWLGFVFQIA